MLDAGLLNPQQRLPGVDPQTAQAIRRLRTALVRCEIEPGQFVGEQEIAERFGLGRAAVRVALTALETAGLVTRRPRQGWRAEPITDNLLRAVAAGRLRLEPALAEIRLSAADRSRLDQAVGIVAALGDRSDRQAVLTVRPADRQIRDALAAHTDEFTRRWLAELWDHRDRIVTALENAGVAIPTADRTPLIAALAAGNRRAAANWLKRDLAREERLIAAAVERANVFASTSAGRSARRRRPRGVKHLKSAVNHQRQE
jgi:DNA-binding GntR family transcriptional regulator